MRRASDPRFARFCIFLALLVTIGFRAVGVTARAGEPRQDAAASGGAAVELELVQTVPVETELGLEGLRDAYVVWKEMLDGAKEHVELAQFYAVDENPPTRLTPVVEALEQAAARGVKVRFLADAGFHDTYPALLDRLGALENVEMRLYDLRSITGGVLHAKTMLVDGREGYLGSQNFDWRSLEHIAELGVRFAGAAVVEAFQGVFEYDWVQARHPEGRMSTTLVLVGQPKGIGTTDGGSVTPVASPPGLGRGAIFDDLPFIVALIDGAEHDVALQFLSYKPADGKEPWTPIDDALRRAAKRGVKVRLLLSHWATRASSLPPLRALQAVDDIEVRVLTVPEHSSGFIPFARVAHSKLIAVDGGAAGWIGTSNAGGDYFTKSRNVGLVLEGGETPRQLARYFDVGWSSPHAAPLDPARDYPEPRVAE